jgi:methylthioribose-1-phosphate isomerase
LKEPHISYQPSVLRLLDQTQLPAAPVFVELHSWAEVAAAIRRLLVRGAPAIGITAAYGLALEGHILAGRRLDDAAFIEGLRRAGEGLTKARPTAVNLGWAVTRMLDVAQAQISSGAAHGVVAAALDAQARAIHEEDIAACHRIGDHGAALFDKAVRIVTHCNTGDLATGGYGTALGVVRSLWRDGRLAHVYVDETRPVLQGARLTAWELQRDAIPYTLIADGMAAHFMQRGAIDAVVVGADRIARNGDTANKIGTYGLAVLARAHGLPFIVAAPRSTFDPALETGSGIVIEERDAAEMTTFAGARSAPAGAAVANPAFDVTPAEYITAIVTESGSLKPPLTAAIAALLDGASYAKAAR